eukprot:TRINITY_DN3737_c0_g1_i1.p1 TRINITY_DN3737_c0_g1~~TRINITY_DN3737_c0_g1_i1.p1  ORF type:complete len:725 (-),score=190.42 TRINITY_DN3737_c0_g1_i1:246-2420(-)
MEETRGLLDNKETTNRKFLYIGIGVAINVILFVIGLTLILVYVVDMKGDKLPNYNKYHQKFLDNVDKNKISGFIKQYSDYPHLAGIDGDYQTALNTTIYLGEWGVKAFNHTFPVLLSYPLRRNLQVTNPPEYAYTAKLEEDCIPVDEPSCLPNGIPTFNGYSGSGTVSGPLVYVNYGRREDFEALNGTVDFNGTIVIVRYGQNFRGNKPANAENYGAKGCIIFVDPGQVGYLKGEVFPEGPWATNDTVQRGTVKLSDGDPTTMGWPSEQDGARYSLDQIRTDPDTMYGLPMLNIPVIPIGYGDAQNILKGLAGGPLPDPSWESGLNLTSVGPSLEVLLDVLMNDTVTNIWNVHGIIEGEIEPDRFVLFGSHRDAWTMGASDPISGHSVSLEVMRGLSELVKSGWKPRRSIIFCSWDAEEYGLVGSVEFLEKTEKRLRDQGVAYLNLDTAVKGHDYLKVSGVPSLNKVVTEAAMASIIEGTGKSLYDIWDGHTVLPAEGGSDDHTFLMRYGIPILKSQIFSYKEEYSAVYHSNYDSYYWITHFGDTNFTYHAAMAKFYGTIVLRLADDSVLPFDYVDYANDISQRIQSYKTKFNNLDIDWSSLENAITYMNTSALSINTEIEEYQKWENGKGLREIMGKSYQLRNINDRLMKADQALISDQTLMTGSQWNKHIIYSTSDDNSYASDLFPALYGELFLGNATQAQFLLKRIATQITGLSDYLQNKF